MQNAEALQGRRIADLYEAGGDTSVRPYYLIGIGETLSNLELFLNDKAAPTWQVWTFLRDIALQDAPIMLLAISNPDVQPIYVLSVPYENNDAFIKHAKAPHEVINVKIESHVQAVVESIQSILHQPPKKPYTPYVAALIPNGHATHKPTLVVGTIDQRTLGKHFQLFSDIRFVQNCLGYNDNPLFRRIPTRPTPYTVVPSHEQLKEESVRLSEELKRNPRLYERVANARRRRG